MCSIMMSIYHSGTLVLEEVLTVGDGHRDVLCFVRVGSPYIYLKMVVEICCVIVSTYHSLGSNLTMSFLSRDFAQGV